MAEMTSTDIKKLINSLNPYTHDMVLDPLEMEIEDHYQSTWPFKGQEKKVRKAVRVKYTFKNADNFPVTEYLLIGFEGSGGGE
jgi:hypothetical protein